MILVTGASGVLGKALTAALTRNGDAFRILSTNDGDLRDEATTLRLFQEIRPRLVFHLAARVHGLMGNKCFPAEMFIDNVRINSNVIDAAHKVQCKKIVAISSVAVYSSDCQMPISEEMIWDGPPHGSEASYGHVKRAMLAQLEAYNMQYGMAYACPILTNIYGPHDRFDSVYGHVVPSLIAKFYKSARDGTGVSVWGTGIAERDFISGQDAARALLLIAEKHIGPINVATGMVCPIRDMVDILQKISKVDRITWDRSKPDGQIHRRYDVSKLLNLGFEPELSLAEGLDMTYRWYAENFPNVRSS
ncbi:MAG: NAD-dependent epimerase/dehydratase family protein [Acidobacteriaceae bacterium]|nr:NAD-dependent epimerase/dehydratase family protein [Acidobacteriaceae bacterium]